MRHSLIHSFTHSLIHTFIHSWPPLDTAPSADHEETLPRKFCLSDTGHFLIIADSLAPGDQHLLSQKSKGFTIVVLSSNTISTTTNLTVFVEWGRGLWGFFFINNQLFLYYLRLLLILDVGIVSKLFALSSFNILLGACPG